MSNTVDLPADLYQQAAAIARDTASNVNEVVASYLRRALESEQATETELRRSELTGLPVVRVGRVITAADVRQLAGPSGFLSRSTGCGTPAPASPRSGR
jgi:hypothetical protein